MSVVTMKALLESGVHFGHQTHKWNPKMDKFIFIKRNGIHILDFKQTLDAVNEAYMFIKELISKGETILFVGTKKQAKEAIEVSAKKSGIFYVNNRWYGGMLTNIKTIRRSIEKLDYYEQIVEDGTINSFTKLEAQKMKKTYDKINNGLGGVREMDRQPGVVFIVDIIKEKIAVNEARKLKIPIVAMVDTNADPDLVDYIIPANDDAIRAIHLITDIMANAVIEGKQSLLEGADIIQPESEKDKELTTKETKEEVPVKEPEISKKDTEEKAVKPASKKAVPKKEKTEKAEPAKVSEKKAVKKDTEEKAAKPASKKTATKKEKTEKAEPVKATEKKAAPKKVKTDKVTSAKKTEPTKKEKKKEKSETTKKENKTAK